MYSFVWKIFVELKLSSNPNKNYRVEFEQGGLDSNWAWAPIILCWAEFEQAKLGSIRTLAERNRLKILYCVYVCIYTVALEYYKFVKQKS